MRTLSIIITFSFVSLIITSQDLIVDGKVGIATTVASAPLHIKGNNEALRIEGEQSWISFYNDATRKGYLQHEAEDMYLVNEQQDGDIHFRTNNIDRMTINPTGNVGIGTSDPQYKLDVKGGNRNAFKASSASSRGVIGESSNALGRGVEGIGYFGVFGKGAFAVYGDGTSADFFAANGIYLRGSSRRWKSNIENISNPLDKLSLLRGVYFNWDEDHGGNHTVGFIAEEVGEVLPEVVMYEENGIDATGMDYGKMTPLLVEAANAMRKEYQDKFEEQQSEINTLKQEMAELRTFLKAQVKNASED